MKKSIINLTLASIFFAMTACSSVPKEIPMELTAQELIQKGQNEFESGNYKAALCYYNAVTERYQDALPIYAEASYEIGHIYMKQKDYEKASVIFNEVIGLYTHTAPGEIPGAYEKLSKLELSKIPSKN